MEGQERNLDSLDQWAKNNRMMFNKAKCQVLHLCPKNPRQTYRFGAEGLRSWLAKKRCAGVLINSS